MDSNQKQQNGEIEQFLCDVREHFKASLETSEYENASNLFHVTEAEATARLLYRCEILLQQYNNTNKNNLNIYNNNNKQEEERQLDSVSNTPQLGVNEFNTLQKLNDSTQGPNDEKDEVSYLDMTANTKKIPTSTEYMDLNGSIDSDKTFRCSTRLSDICDGKFQLEQSNQHNNTTEENDSFDEETQIYDICQVSQVDIDTSQKSCLTSHECDMDANNCPYSNLSAGHLSIQKSTKYGQLQRIEKRLFFDQSKKCYCGILSDWLLCYDGPTATQPILTLYLRTHGIEIEHSGDGKRREICFQITMGDPNKKFVFQANNEVDAKEWIHAIEAAIRNDIKHPRKLPTPPLVKKITFVNHIGRCNGNGSRSTMATATTNENNDSIYEEPSPVYDAHTPNEHLITKLPDLPDKFNNDSVAMAKKYEYDIPKCPAQPVMTPVLDKSPNSTEIETIGLLNVLNEENTIYSCNGQSTKHLNAETIEKVDFQTKVKDLHNKLSSQLLTVASSTYQERILKKTARKTYSNSSSESETLSLTTSPTAKDQKKQKKSNTPIASPQKSNSNSNNNNNINNNNNNNASDKSAKNWFLNRLNKTTSSVRSSATASMTKCRQSEKENLLNSLDLPENFDCSSSPSSPILKTSSSIATNSNSKTNNNNSNTNKSKVNMIINQFEASGGHLAMFSMEAMANFSAVFNDNDCNNYEPIMTVSTPPSSLLKKV